MYWAIIRYSGRVENLMPNKHKATFWQVLDDLYGELASAGGNHDSPKTLLLNGKVVPMPKDLSSFVYEYRRKKDEAMHNAVLNVQAEIVSHELSAFLGAEDANG